MKAKYIYTLFAAISILGSSCSDFFDREIPPPAYEEHVVMYCMLDPDVSGVYVALSKTEPVFGNEAEIMKVDRTVNDAIVTISDGVKSHVLLRFLGPEDGIYTLSGDSMDLVPGRTYTLTAQVDDKTLRATTTIPSREIDLSTFSVNFDTVSFNNLGGEKDKKGLASVKFRDLPGEQHFYSIWGDLWIDGNGRNFDFGQQHFAFTDEAKDGQELGPFVGQVHLNNGENTDGSFGVFTVQVCDEAMYRYYRYLNSLGEEDGFFVEPAITYSNVENGLGVFGSRLSSSFVVNF